MDVEFWKVAISQLGMAGALAFILLVVVRQLMARDEALIGRLIQVIELNSHALSDIRAALQEIKGFMERLDQRLADVEKNVARIEGRLGGERKAPREF